MATGKDLLAAARIHLGETYVFGARVPMNNANWRGPWDCAEFITYVVNKLTNKLYGYNAAEGESYTGYWQNDVERKIVTAISIEKAKSTPGAILLRRPKTIANKKIIGHIAFCSGTGGTVEARGSKYGVCEYMVGNNNERGWDTGLLIPEIDYQLSPSTDKKLNTFEKFSADEKAFLAPPAALDTSKLIRKLVTLNYLEPSTDRYDEDVMLAIYNFQLSEGLEPSGQPDTDTLATLGV